MLKVRVIPCLTIKNERLVKSVQFSEHRNIGNYIAAVRVFNARDVDELIFLDLDASARGIQAKLLREVTRECAMPVTLGGGVHTIADVATLLACGADKVACNSVLFSNPSLVSEAAKRYGSQCVVVSMDVRRGERGPEVYVDGGRTPSGVNPVVWAQKAEALGAGELFLTSIDRDGMMEGYDTELIEQVSRAVNIPVIASGGAGRPQHCVEAVQHGAAAVAAGSMFQYTEVTPEGVKKELSRFGIPVRLL